MSPNTCTIQISLDDLLKRRGCDQPAANSAIAKLVRLRSAVGKPLAADLPERALDDIHADLIKAGDFHDALTLVRDRIFARIDRAADTANSARQSLERSLQRLPVCRNASTNRSVRAMYLATMSREMPAAVRRVLRGQ